MKEIPIILLAGIALFSASGFAQTLGKDPSSAHSRKVAGGLNFYSIPREIALGKQLAIEVEKQARMVADPVITEYVNRLGQNLALHSDVEFPVSFRLIESDDINAFTLPGGIVFINTGLIKISANEAELASALAHELGHAAARHATRQATRNEIFKAGMIPLGIAGGLGGLAARQAASIGAPMTFLRFSRDFETEADLLGLQYLWDAGYDPNASVDLLETIESTERRQPGSVARLFRTHPLTPDRIAKTQSNIARLSPGRSEYVINTSEYEAIRSRLNELMPSRAPKDDEPALAGK